MSQHRVFCIGAVALLALFLIVTDAATPAQADSLICGDLVFTQIEPLMRGDGIANIAFAWSGVHAPRYRLHLAIEGQVVEFVTGDGGTLVPVSALPKVGVYEFWVAAEDENGHEICRSAAGSLLLDRIAVDPADPVGRCAGAVVVAVFMGSPYIGPADVVVDGNIYIGTNACEDIYGTDQVDYIEGGGGADFIYGFNGNDELYGDAGDDTIYGGDDTCAGIFCLAGDQIDGGAGDDTIYGGDDACARGFICLAGDQIDGGAGDDTIYGGDDTCAGLICLAGDQIAGGAGGDTIYGGDDICAGIFCLAGDDIYSNEAGDGSDGDADTIDGGAGNDNCVFDAGEGDTAVNCP